ncbi:MAG: VWA domain-containing protein [Chloroflexota bacterium]|nr:MAG: VWA domain-containing protein [Chloroflexota bacterium]
MTTRILGSPTPLPATPSDGVPLPATPSDDGPLTAPPVAECVVPGAPAATAPSAATRLSLDPFLTTIATLLTSAIAVAVALVAAGFFGQPSADPTNESTRPTATVVTERISSPSLTDLLLFGVPLQPRTPVTDTATMETDWTWQWPEANVGISETRPGLPRSSANPTRPNGDRETGGPAVPGVGARATTPVVGPGAPAYIGFVLDSSGSMHEEAENGRRKIDQARQVVIDTIARLPDSAFASVRVFGHRIPETDKRESCRDTEMVVPFLPGRAASERFASVAIAPRGWTALASNLELTVQELPNGVNRIVVLVSDGKETCGGQPEAVARRLRAADANLSIYTVGFGVDADARTQLRAIAESGAGAYEDAIDAAGLSTALRRVIERATGSPPAAS